MLIVEETTPGIVNHIYYLSDDRTQLFGYQPFKKEKAVIFKKGIRFDPMHRSFKLLRKVKA